MKNIIMKVVGLLCIFFGAGSFLLYALTQNSGRLSAAGSISQMNGIAVTSTGEIIVGDDQSSSIQVFDANGTFLHGYSFGNQAGGFRFGIDAEDTVHIILDKTSTCYEYNSGELTLVAELEDDWEKRSEYMETYHIIRQKATKVNGIEYRWRLGHKIEVTAEDGSSTMIKLEVPAWPWPIWSYFAVFGVGLVFMKCSDLVKEKRDGNYVEKVSA